MRIKVKRPQPEVHSKKHSNGHLTLRDVLERVDDYRQTGENQWEAICPTHPDQKPSLHVSEGENGRLLMHCKAGCRFEDILKELESCEPLRTVEQVKPEGSPTSMSGTGPKVQPASPMSPPALPEVMDLYDELAEAVIKNSSEDSGRLVYVESGEGEFYKYSKQHHSYAKLPKEALSVLIRDAASVVGVAKRKLISVNEGFLKNVTLALQSRLYKTNPSIRLNAERNVLNLHNGLLNLETMELSEHRDDFYSTISFNLEFYNREPDCPRWLYTLDEIFENDLPEVRKEKIKILQQFFGLCLTADTRFQKILILIGHGANGKGVVCSVLQALLGKDNYSCLSMEHLASNFNLVALKGKLVNFCSEISSKGVVPDSMLKMLSGEDTIYADRKYKPGIQFRPFAKLIFSMNEIPTITDRSLAFYRRLLVLEFTRIFGEREQDPNLKEKLLVELSDIFLWALKGRTELLKQRRFLTSKKMEEAVTKFKRENNSVLAYVEDWCEVNPVLKLSECVSISRAYEVYMEWCERNGASPFAKIKFGKLVTGAFPTVEQTKATDGQRIWKGLRFSRNCPPGLSGQFRRKLS